MAETHVQVEPPSSTRAPVMPSAAGLPVFHNRHPMHHDRAAAAQALAEMEGFRQAQDAQHDRHRSEFYSLGRLMLSVFFVVAGIVKLIDLAALELSVETTVLAGAGFLIPIAIAVQLLGGALLAIGYQARVVAAGLIAYLGGVTFLMHSDLTVATNRTAALVNLALSGGLLLILGQGSGGLSVDRLLEQRRTRRERL